MKDGVKKFWATDYETEYANGHRGQVLVVPAADYDALIAEVEELRKDAERYRWIRNPDQVVGHVIDKMVSSGIYEYRAGDELDDAIDDAMEQS